VFSKTLQVKNLEQFARVFAIAELLTDCQQVDLRPVVLIQTVREIVEGISEGSEGQRRSDRRTVLVNDRRASFGPA
jgi:hypothetical protein